MDELPNHVANYQEPFKESVYTQKRNIWEEDMEEKLKQPKQNAHQTPVRPNKSRKLTPVALKATAAKTSGNEAVSKKKKTIKQASDHNEHACPVCHKAFRTLGALGSHKRNCRNEPVATRGRPLTGSSYLSLAPETLADQAECLSDFCHLVIQSLDLYQVQASDLPLPTRGQFEIREGSIGIRCHYCANKRSVSVASILFPGNLKLVSINVYRIAERHLMAMCPHIPEKVRSQLKEMKVETTRQSMTKGRIGLPTYLKAVMDYHNLVPFSDSKGIYRQLNQTNGEPRDKDP